MQTLRSYLQDRWVEGAEPHATLHDAYTGEPIAQASSNGHDLGAALEHGRAVGGPALRQMTFSERAALLKAMSETIHGARDELIDIARRNSGNTRSDAKFDIDGASGTLAYYASLGRKLGDQKWLWDGESEPLLRSPRFVGRHMWVPRQGVAVHINAFNFPAWGLCEKAATAILAGVPVLAKPSTSTAWLAMRIVEHWAEAGILPQGAMSLLVGSAGDLLDHVGPQDCIAFTGSAATGRIVRGHPRVVEMSVPVNVEADSLNAAVLGPDVEPGSDTFQMFVNEVSREITQKAGQKCTAIRRILVPKDRVDAVTEALTDRVEQATMGDPAERATTLGPLATKGQAGDVVEAIGQLSQTAKPLVDEVPVPEQGYFVAPRLFLSEQGIDDPFVHDHEIFGPVSTILPWDGDAQGAVALVARGGGSLVTSLYTDDVDFGREVLLGIAPWNGRVMWGSRKVHDQTPGPGTVLPNLVHGGPGRAGGGEELGGERGLKFYMLRVAVQGDRALLDRAFR